MRLDLSRQKKLIPPNVRLGLKLYPAEDSFRLITSSDEKTYKLEIKDVSLKTSSWKKKSLVFSLKR